jgi:hypothetical protein
MAEEAAPLLLLWGRRRRVVGRFLLVGFIAFGLRLFELEFKVGVFFFKLLVFFL